MLAWALIMMILVTPWRLVKRRTTYPNLVQALFDPGYADANIKKILGNNLLRVWRASMYMRLVRKTKISI